MRTGCILDFLDRIIKEGIERVCKQELKAVEKR
jgi:hypothetical protein